jgi:hypothetical protein
MSALCFVFKEVDYYARDSFLWGRGESQHEIEVLSIFDELVVKELLQSCGEFILQADKRGKCMLI